MVRGTRWETRGPVLVVRIQPWIRMFCNVQLFLVPHSWNGSVQIKSSMAFIKESLFEFQLLGECHCWWTNESPRAHVAKFYGRLRLICSVWRASYFSVFKIDWNCNFVCLLHHPFWLQLVLALFGNYFSTFYTTCLAKDQWRGFSTRNAHLVHIVNFFRQKMVYTS